MKVLQDISNIPKNIKLTVHKIPKRIKLIRWLFEVCVDFKYKPYTHIRSVIMLDKYLKKYNKTSNSSIVDLQLIGISILFVSAKIEETKIKNIAEYVAVTDFTYSKNDILKYEYKILKFFSFDTNFVMPFDFYTALNINTTCNHNPLNKITSTHAIDSNINKSILHETSFNELLALICCFVLEKEINPYFVMENAKKILESIILNGPNKEIRFYLDGNTKVSEYLLKNIENK